jgi:hypothetical protein
MKCYWLCQESMVKINLYLIFLGGSTGVWTQGLTLARQVLYHFSHSTSPVATMNTRLVPMKTFKREFKQKSFWMYTSFSREWRKWDYMNVKLRTIKNIHSSDSISYRIKSPSRVVCSFTHSSIQLMVIDYLLCVVYIVLSTGKTKMIKTQTLPSNSLARGHINVDNYLVKM